eukprot:TRINITY_DN8331_c0_g1_i1.p1 TRINITY_DN8331_c0_g1~~TRINITY_DN8331_c0_g1_i1.p1  ORF type:complete len:178 (-),score=40.33 TRINITY_DN8331_c0_g1_i1:89-622(-)
MFQFSILLLAATARGTRVDEEDGAAVIGDPSSSEKTLGGGENLWGSESESNDQDSSYRLPDTCRKFFADECDFTDFADGQLETKDDFSKEFQSCCEAGGHGQEACSSIASEVFGKHEGLPTEEQCSEMVRLFEVHVSWAHDMLKQHLGKSDHSLLAHMDTSLKRKNHYGKNKGRGKR